MGDIAIEGKYTHGGAVPWCVCDNGSILYEDGNDNGYADGYAYDYGDGQAVHYVPMLHQELGTTLIITQI